MSTISPLTPSPPSSPSPSVVSVSYRTPCLDGGSTFTAVAKNEEEDNMFKDLDVLILERSEPECANPSEETSVWSGEVRVPMPQEGESAVLAGKGLYLAFPPNHDFELWMLQVSTLDRHIDRCILYLRCILERPIL